MLTKSAFHRKKMYFIVYSRKIILYLNPQISCLTVKKTETTSSDIFCAAFGHNYVRQGSKLTCKACNQITSENTIENISGAPKNNEVMTFLRFLLTKTSTLTKTAFS